MQKTFSQHLAELPLLNPPTPPPHFHLAPTGWGTNETFSGSKDILRVVRSSPHSSSVDSNFGTIRFFHAASFFPCGKLSQHCWVLTRVYCVMIRYHVFLAGIFISWFLGQSAFIFGEVTSPLWHQHLCHIGIPRPSQYTFTLYLESWPHACLCCNQTRSQVHFSPEATKPVVGNNQMLATGNPVHYCHLPLSLLQQNEISIFFSFLPLLNHRTRDLGNKGDMNAWNGDLSWDNNQKTFLVTLPWTTDEALTKSGRGSFKAWAGWTDR